MKNIIFLLLMLITASCLTTQSERLEAKRQRKCDKAAWRWGCNQGVSDSIMKITETITIYQDTTVFIHLPGKIVHDTVEVIVDKNGLVNSKKSYLFTSIAESWAMVQNGKLLHRLSQNDTLIEQNIQNAIRETKTTEKEKEVKTLPPVMVNYLTGWQKIVQVLGYVLIVSVFLCILIFVPNIFK
jgi:hypothetical protein